MHFASTARRSAAAPSARRSVARPTRRRRDGRRADGAPHPMLVEALERRQLLSGGDFSLDFVAAAPFTYDHSTGGGAYDDRTIGETNDVVESLEGGDFAPDDVVTYFVAISVDDEATDAQTIELDFEFLADTTGQSGVGFYDIVFAGVNYGVIAGGVGDGPGGTDAGNIDNGNSVGTLTSETLPSNPFNDGTTNLLGTVEITNLEAGEQVILRIDVLIGADLSSSPTGNLQASITNGRVTDPAPDAIPVGQQTVPFKQLGLLVVEPALKSGTKFLDLNANGVRDADGIDDVAGNSDDEAGLSGVEIRAYADTDGDGLLDQDEFDAGAEATDTTDANGLYELELLAGDYVVVEVLQPTWFQSAPGGPTVLDAALVTGATTFGANGYAITLDAGEEETGNDFGNFQNATKSGLKFHDRNADGLRDADGIDDVASNGDDEVTLSGWEIRAYADDGDGVLEQAEFDAGPAATDVTDGAGEYSLTLPPGDYVVVEVLQANWVQTAPTGLPVLEAGLVTGGVTLGARGFAINLTSGEAEPGNDFGNALVEGGGGHTLGFWSNKNGQKVLEDGGSVEPELLLLRNLNLKNANGTNFDPLFYDKKNDPARSLKPWLLNATATNMAYMLSVQMGVMALNVEASAGNAGFVNGSSLVHAPALLPFVAKPGLGANLSAVGCISVNDLINAANIELGTNSLVLSGNPNRAYQQALKNALDDANNNLNFIC